MDPVLGEQKCLETKDGSFFKSIFGSKLCSGDRLVDSPNPLYIDKGLKVKAGFITELDDFIDGDGNTLTTGSIVLETGSELVYGGSSLNDNDVYIYFLGVSGLIDFACVDDCKNPLRKVRIMKQAQTSITNCLKEMDKYPKSRIQ